MKIFKDRKAAGKLLAKHLKQYKSKNNTLILGIPRGGVVVAAEVSKKLKLPLDIIVTRKIGDPKQQELALGAVDPDGSVIWDEQLMNELGLKVEDLVGEVSEEIEEIKRREKTYRHDKKPLKLTAKTVILIDDGIATGATFLSAVNYLINHKVKKIILAVPIASEDALKKISHRIGKSEERVVLEIPIPFQAVSKFYQQFLAVSDEEVIEYLKHE